MRHIGFQMAKRILIVDDASTVLLLEEVILNQAGFSTLRASNGQDGVNKALAERPDLILMDVKMPVLDGFEACRILRLHHQTRSIPIIMVTSRSEEENVEIGFSSGCNDYVTKPIDRVELVSKIRNYLDLEENDLMAI